MAFNMAGDKVLNERRISDLEYAHYRSLRNKIMIKRTLFYVRRKCGSEFFLGCQSVYELISYDESCEIGFSIQTEKIKIYPTADKNLDGWWFIMMVLVMMSFSEFMVTPRSHWKDLLIKGSHKKGSKSTQITFKERTPRSEKTDLKKYQRTTVVGKIFVDIHELLLCCRPAMIWDGT